MDDLNIEESTEKIAWALIDIAIALEGQAADIHYIRKAIQAEREREQENVQE